jgi:hypothetical protein
MEYLLYCGQLDLIKLQVDGNGIFPISTTLLENMTSIRHHQRNSHVPNPDGMQLKETIEGAMEDSGYDSGQKDDPSPAYSRSSSLEVEAPRLMKDLPPLPLNTTTISELMKQLPRELLGKVTDIWEQDNKPLRQRRSSSLEPFWAVPSPEPPLYTVQPYFEIKRSPKGGYGAFALQDIRKNKVILEESPLLEAHTATFIQEFEKLSKKEQGEVMSLTCFSELSDDKRIATFKTNRYAQSHQAPILHSSTSTSIATNTHPIKQIRHHPRPRRSLPHRLPLQPLLPPRHRLPLRRAQEETRDVDAPGRQAGGRDLHLVRRDGRDAVAELWLCL